MATAKKQDKKDFPDIPRSHGVLGKPGKMVKMIQARCTICNEHGWMGQRGWWDDCPHDPYYHFEPKPGVKTMERRVLNEGTPDEEEVWVKLKLPQESYQRVPNWKQIAHDIKITSGRMVQIQIERGSKFPQDLGYPPICDYKDCWEINPTVVSQYAPAHEESDVLIPIGTYHSKDEAALMVLRFEGVPTYIRSDTSISKGNPTRLRRQIEEAKSRV